MAVEQTVTLVFSDIEHSTRLAQQLRGDYPELLEQHRSTIRSIVAKYKGREIDTAGDGFFITFPSPLSAVLAAAAIQKSFFLEKWSASIGLKVRMGIHTGQVLATKSGLTGVEVHRASRICNAAHGGQVLLSESTRREIEKNKLPDDTHIVDLGTYKLKDFDDPVALFQLNVEGIQNSFPALRVDPNEKRLAVLPFLNKNKDPELEHIGEGMAEEVIIALGKVPGLRVVSRATAFSMKNGTINPLKVGKKLNVGAVLEGMVTKTDRQMKVLVELIDAQTALNLWSKQYSSAKNHLIKIQDDITRNVTSVLGCQLDQSLHLGKQRQTHNAEAYDFYLRGRRFYLQFSNRGIELAIQMFKKAIENDETYALAYAGLADCYSFQFQHKAPSKASIDKAEEVSQKAVDLAPSLAEVYVSRGIVLGLQQKNEEAEQAFGIAIELDPSLFLGWYHFARMCFAVGKLDKAARLFEQANRVEPEDYQSIYLAGQCYEDIGTADLSRALRERGVSIAEKWLDLNPGDTRALYLTANALVFLGQKEKSLELLKRSLLLEPDDSMLLYNAGCVYALLGMSNEALNCLERSYKAGLTLLGWYENDSNLDSLRTHPRFIKMINQIKKDTTHPSKSINAN